MLCGDDSNNEEIVGEALAPFENNVQIATKFGIKHEGRSLICDSRPETIRKSAEGSLRRLGVERIDLYYQHRIDPKVHAEEVAGVMLNLSKKAKSRIGAFRKLMKNIYERLMRFAP